MIIISNSSPLIALGRIDQLNILELMFGEIYIPNTVYQETVTETRFDTQRNAILAAIQTEAIKVVEPSVKHTFIRKLGIGEQGVMNLALEKNADQIILDDKRARKEAIELGLTVVYTADILKGAEKRGFIPSSTDIFQQLNAIGIYLPE